MKLIIVIVSNKDASKLLSAVSADGYFATRVSTSGQFLEGGHTTVLMGVSEDRVDSLFSIIEKNVTKRVVRKVGVESTIEGSLLKKPVDVEEYGAVAFVVDVEEFKKF
ncbi:MAG: cyclic-di-AMP receptor [Eubacterium sp.]